MAFRSSLILKAHNLSKNLLCSRLMVTVTAPTLKKADDPKDLETHTGQKFENDDYRLSRFTNKQKEVNTAFAIDLIASVPPKDTEKRVVWCDGGGGPTGHPRVYINLDQPGNHSCGYCGLRFHKDDHHH